jgi:hypothetical protein
MLNHPRKKAESSGLFQQKNASKYYTKKLIEHNIKKDDFTKSKHKRNKLGLTV